MVDLALLLLPSHSAKRLKAQDDLLANSTQLLTRPYLPHTTAVSQNGDRFRGGLERYILNEILG